MDKRIMMAFSALGVLALVGCGDAGDNTSGKTGGTSTAPSRSATTPGSSGAGTPTTPGSTSGSGSQTGGTTGSASGGSSTTPSK